MEGKVRGREWKREGREVKREKNEVRKGERWRSPVTSLPYALSRPHLWQSVVRNSAVNEKVGLPVMAGSLQTRQKAHHALQVSVETLSGTTPNGGGSQEDDKIAGCVTGHCLSAVQCTLCTAADESKGRQRPTMDMRFTGPWNCPYIQVILYYNFVSCNR